MSEVHTGISLVNIGDQNDADRGYMPQDQVRRLTVNAVVDTGAWTLVINCRSNFGLTILPKKALGYVKINMIVYPPCCLWRGAS